MHIIIRAHNTQRFLALNLTYRLYTCTHNNTSVDAGASLGASLRELAAM